MPKNTSNTTQNNYDVGTFDNYDLSAGKEFAVKVDFTSSKNILRYDLINTNLKQMILLKHNILICICKTSPSGDSWNCHYRSSIPLVELDQKNGAAGQAGP